jgi:hypothetical protein
MIFSHEVYSQWGKHTTLHPQNCQSRYGRF